MDIKYDSRGRARLGVIVPFTNTNLEPDMMMLAPKGVSLHFARAGGYDADEIPDEQQMQQYSDSMPKDVIESLAHCRVDAVIYGCTSATLAQGPEYDREFRSNIERVIGAPCVTAAGALVEVLQKLQVSRFAFTSPYVASLNDLAIAFLEAFDMTCSNRLDASERMSNQVVGETRPGQIVDLAIQADHPAAQAIVVSCTDYRATEAIPEIEARLGKPVITSNQATLLVALKHLGIDAESTLASHLAAARFALDE